MPRHGRSLGSRKPSPAVVAGLSDPGILSGALAKCGFHFWDYDVRRRICAVGPGLADLFGEGRLARGVMTIPVWNRLVHPGDRARIRAQRRAMRGERPVCFQYRIVRPLDGGVRWIESFAVASVCDATGRPLRIVGALWDVTDRESQRERDNHLRRMGLLAAGIVHDFGNVVQAVSSNAELVAVSAPGQGTVGRAAARILRSAARGAAIVDRLRPRPGRRPDLLRAIDAGEAVRESRDLIELAAGPRIRVAIDVASDLPMVAADRTELETVLVNLAANARDAMPGGGSIRLLVAVSRRAARGHGAPWLSITVSDDGCGMDDATRRRAREPFFTTKSAGRGSGLGLSLAEAFARRHGGRLAMESAPGRGTAVTISLPAQCTACTPAAGDHVAPSRLRD